MATVMDPRCRPCTQERLRIRAARQGHFMATRTLIDPWTTTT